jgi:cytochrome c oxidase assembly protein subunit 15
MVGGILYEHGHRLVASAVGMLMVILAVWLWLKEPRRWVKRLGWLALLAVIVQGILGGLTVLFFLPAAISVSHGALAQTFFCLTICLALFTSRQWQREAVKIEDIHRPSLQTLTIATTAAVFVQLILGAVMRHTKSGLAIPDFPLAFGKLIPPFDSAKIAIHFSHRIGALIVTIFVVWTVARILQHYRHQKKLFRPALLLICALLAQVTLGAFTIWTQKAVIITTAHVATGALILGTSLVLALRAYRLLIVSERDHIEDEIQGMLPETR